MNYDEYKNLKREPQIYNGIEIYPILLFDYKYYDIFMEIMCMPKDYISNKEIIKMSYLKYLLLVIQGSFDSENENNAYCFKDKLIELLSYVTKSTVEIVTVIDSVQEGEIKFHYNIYVGKHILSEFDFDQIREIILLQNGKSIEYIESYNPELEESLMVFHKSGKYIPLKYRINIYSVISHTDISEMENWTVVEFEDKEQILKLYENWKLYKPLEASGQITYKSSKDKTPNPFEYMPKSNDRYSEILMSTEEMMDVTGLKQFSSQI